MKKCVSIILSAALIIGTVFTPGIQAKAATSIPSNANLLNTYGKLFGKVGNALPASKMLNSSIINDTKKEYNSVTAENEMKPDAILGSSATSISISQAKALGYYIPDNYPESTVPKLNFTTVDNMLKVCYDNGLSMRGHTLVWHSQTPNWYFKTGYSSSGSYVSQDVMNKRMEFYIRTVMGHVHSSQYGSVVYAWDVVNEYLHASNSGWQAIYGSNLGPKAGFVKSAFKYAYDALEYYKLTDKVKLFYNDYNEYMEVNNIITLINYINAEKKICAGIGMQSHLSTTFPSVDYYKSGLQAFAKAGFEIQITELDAGATSSSEQAKYYYDLMSAILSVKKAGGNITALVWWGLCDDYSWRSADKPLLFSTYKTPKEAYKSVLQAYFDAGYTLDSTTPTNPTNPTTGTRVECEDMSLGGTYAGKITSPLNGVSLYGNNDYCAYNQYFGYSAHNFSVQGCSSNSSTARVDLQIGGKTVGSFYFTGTTPTVQTLSNISHGTGDQEVKLITTTDDGTWDAYVDYFEINTSSGDQPTTPTYKLGDVNKSGSIDIIDCIQLKKLLLNDSSAADLTVADMNKDGKVNIIDYVQLKKILIS